MNQTKLINKINIKQIGQYKKLDTLQIILITEEQNIVYPLQMKQSSTENESNQQTDSKQRSFHRLLELYYNNNIATQANMLKKCIPDIDTNYENRLIRKNDKIWVQANLYKIFQKASNKLQKLFLLKNQNIKNSLDSFQNHFQNLPCQKISEIHNSFQFIRGISQYQHKKHKKLNFLPNRNKSFSIQNVNSEPSYQQSSTRKTYSSKRVFRVRQYKNCINQTVNTRYIERLQKVKLQSTFAQFFFKKQINPEQSKPKQIQKIYVDKIKAMTNIRWNFQQSQNSHNLIKPLIQRQNTKLNNYLGFQLKRQSFYKPKSKCHSRNNKLFLNF